MFTCFLLTNHVSRVAGRESPEEQLRLTQSPIEYSGSGGVFSKRGAVFGVTEKEVRFWLSPRLQRSLDGLPLKENLNFLMVDPRDDLVSG